MRILLCCICLLLSALAGADPLPPMLALRAPADVDPAAYWVSEKLDGVRARWDGEALRLRNGERIAAPAWFTRPLPALPLDGELWMARGRFDALSGLIRRQQPDEADWREVRYMLFELPGADGDFSARLERLKAIERDAGAGWIRVVPQCRVADRDQLDALFREVVGQGGEALLKMTPFEDAEATVVGHLPGRGRLRGKLGALAVIDTEGRRFRVGSGFTDAQRASPPAVGALITYRFRERTPRGLPRFPVFVRERLLP